MQRRNENVMDLGAQAVSRAGDPAETAALAAEVVNVYQNSERQQQLRILEAVLFAAGEPLDEATLTDRLPQGSDLAALIDELRETYRGRGVNLVCVAGKWAFRTAEDLSFVMRKDSVEQRKLSRAALETLAIVAYHQPVTRAEIEEVRGVSISKGTLDLLLEVGWIRMRGRRRTPGRPVTYGTTDDFLSHFGLETANDLPGLADLKAAGLLDGNLPSDFLIPVPAGEDGLTEDEDPLEDDLFGPEPDFDEDESDDHFERLDDERDDLIDD